jgi:uncharacterized protein YndB with AHSA1/START domain
MSKKSKGSSAKKSSKKKASKPAKVKKTKPLKKVAAKKAPANKKIVKTAKKSPAKPAKKLLKPVKVVKKIAEKVPAPKPIKAKTVIVEKPVKKIESKPVVDENNNYDEPIVSKKNSDSKNSSSDVLAVSNTIPKTVVNPLSASKIASISSSITNPIKKVDSYSVKPEKEPNGKYEIEIVVRSSSEMLYEFLSTPSGLSEWFCDDVNIRNGIYTFIWDGQLQQARLLKTIDDQLVRFQWVDKTDGSYFEFKIQKDDLTNDTSLLITDFAESVSERESSKRLWTSQVEKLLHIIGSIF